MKPFDTFLAEKRDVTIHTLASYTRQYVQERWQPVWEAQRDELLRVYDKAGDHAYGVYGRALFRPVQEHFAAAGFVCEPDFPGHFRTTSVEHWGPPEERERCLWCVAHAPDGTPLGTLVTQLFHDHTQLRLPHPPRVFALEETARSAILAALARASVRLGGAARGEPEDAAPAPAARPGWSYSVEVGLADCLDPDHLELAEALLDQALDRWGHYGWELVAAVPHEGRLLAFFKRPADRDA